MNPQKLNRYERYEVHDNFNATPNGPTKATDFITVDDSVKAMKILYGNSSKEDEQILTLSDGWGKEPDNIEIIDAWINRDLLNPSWMQELGM